MVFYTTIINSVFAILIASTFWLSKGSNDYDFLLNLLFYIIITPIITITLSKIMYSSENEMIVEDAINRIESILEIKPLPEAGEKKKISKTSIKFENVSFCYEGASKNALNNINLDIGNCETSNANSRF